MPELMIIDEIGRLKEVQAALTCKVRWFIGRLVDWCGLGCGVGFTQHND